jgi:hypothetical protein
MTQWRNESIPPVKQYYYDAAGHMITEANASGTKSRGLGLGTRD